MLTNKELMRDEKKEMKERSACLRRVVDAFVLIESHVGKASIVFPPVIISPSLRPSRGEPAVGAWERGGRRDVS